MSASISKSVRLPDSLYREVQHYRGDMNFAQVVTQALTVWLERQRRAAWGDIIERALTSRPPEQVAAESRLAKAASASGRRALGKEDGPDASTR